jgi:hypothetical protein
MSKTKTVKLTDNQRRVLAHLEAAGGHDRGAAMYAAGIKHWLNGCKALEKQKYVARLAGDMTGYYAVTTDGYKAMQAAGMPQTEKVVSDGPGGGVVLGVTAADADTQASPTGDAVADEPAQVDADKQAIELDPAFTPDGPARKITLRLVGLDGNAFSLMGAFSAQAKKEGWAKADIDAVMNDAMSGDYDHLLRVLSSRCESPREDDDGDEDGADEAAAPQAKGKVEVWAFEELTEKGLRYSAEVLKLDTAGTVVYKTVGHDSPRQAQAAAGVWAENNGYEVA